MPSPTALPALRDNYIWTLAGANGRAVVVDPGEAAPVLTAMEQGLRPCAILLTHHHADHIGAAAELAERCGVPVYAPEDRRIDCASSRVGEGDAVDLPAAGLRFTVMQVPGHTLTHIVYVGEGVVFTGDTLFSLGCGRLFEGSPAQMFDSLQRIAALPGDLQLCCGHEYTLANAAFAQVVDPTNPALAQRIGQARAARALDRPTLPVLLATELATNPFLRCDDPQVAASVAAQCGSQASDALDTFAALRRWKDGFVAP
ncbi:hydroxyacylglutathione hydrolase [Xanthomonadaceae bacterium XH05]|nr:hydroxyacylglutathione hydrolase [Xanthomonadaceae bacterium XH05]